MHRSHLTGKLEFFPPKPKWEPIQNRKRGTKSTPDRKGPWLDPQIGGRHVCPTYLSVLIPSTTVRRLPNSLTVRPPWIGTDATAAIGRWRQPPRAHQAPALALLLAYRDLAVGRASGRRRLPRRRRDVGWRRGVER